jgi:hypothetical protein
MGSDSDSSPLQPPQDGQDTAQEVLGGFPRHLTQQLIDEERRSAARWVGLAPWLVGIGLAALALANPQEALFGGGPRLIQAWASGAGPGEAFSAYWLLRGLAAVSGLDLEPAAFLLSALFYGGTAPLLFGLGRGVGLSDASALTVTLIVLLSPVAWLAGTTPGPEAAGLWATTLLFRLIWGGREGATGTRHRVVVLSALALAAGLSPSAAWLLPAVAIALARDRGVREPLKWGAIGSLFLATAYLALGGPSAASGSLGAPGALPGTGGSGLAAATWRTLALFPALGVSLAGLAALCFERRNESEEPPPRWLLGWALLPSVALALGGAGHELPYLYLLPLAALGGFDALGRREDELDARLVLGAFLLACAWLVGSMHLLSSQDPLADWRAEARRALEPDDLVLTDDTAHHYLLRQRWGLDVRPLDGSTALLEALAQARAAGTRIVFDGPAEELPRELEGVTPLSELIAGPR